MTLKAQLLLYASNQQQLSIGAVLLIIYLEKSLFHAQPNYACCVLCSSCAPLLSFVCLSSRLWTHMNYFNEKRVVYLDFQLNFFNKASFLTCWHAAFSCSCSHEHEVHCCVSGSLAVLIASNIRPHHLMSSPFQLVHSIYKILVSSPIVTTLTDSLTRIHIILGVQSFQGPGQKHHFNQRHQSQA